MPDSPPTARRHSAACRTTHFASPCSADNGQTRADGSFRCPRGDQYAPTQTANLGRVFFGQVFFRRSRPPTSVGSSAEQREVAEGQSDNAQLWEVSDIRDDLDDQAVTELRQVNHALKLLDAGEYGICEDCGEPIPEPRLRAVPYATLCIECAEDEEAS